MRWVQKAKNSKTNPRFAGKYDLELFIWCPWNMCIDHPHSCSPAHSFCSIHKTRQGINKAWRKKKKKTVGPSTGRIIGCLWAFSLLQTHSTSFSPNSGEGKQKCLPHRGKRRSSTYTTMIPFPNLFLLKLPKRSLQSAFPTHFQCLLTFSRQTISAFNAGNVHHLLLLLPWSLCSSTRQDSCTHARLPLQRKMVLKTQGQLGTDPAAGKRDGREVDILWWGCPVTFVWISCPSVHFRHCSPTQQTHHPNAQWILRPFVCTSLSHWESHWLSGHNCSYYCSHDNNYCTAVGFFSKSAIAHRVAQQQLHKSIGILIQDFISTGKTAKSTHHSCQKLKKTNICKFVAQ